MTLTCSSVALFPRFVQWLQAVKTTLTSVAGHLPVTPQSHTTTQTLVLGNEACGTAKNLQIYLFIIHSSSSSSNLDLDSLVSSLSYAFLNDLKSTNSTLTLPLIPISSSEFILRTESTWLLNHVNALESNKQYTDYLTFIDEIPTSHLDSLIHSPSSSLVLTDHNKLSPSLFPPSNKNVSFNVTAVFDHHVDEGLYLTASPRIIAPVGSATTLIVQQWKSFLERDTSSNTNNNASGAHATEEINQYHMDASFAKFLIAPILIDTINLDPSMNRVTPLDREMFTYLDEVIRREAAGNSTSTTSLWDSSVFFRQLQKAKSDISHLSSLDLLRKDYKEWIIVLNDINTESSNKKNFKIGISSVGWFLEDWEKRDHTSASAASTLSDNISSSSSPLITHFNEFSSAKDLDMLLVMTAFEHPKKVVGKEPQVVLHSGFERELVVFVPSAASKSHTDTIPASSSSHPFLTSINANFTSEFLDRLESAPELDLTPHPAVGDYSKSSLSSPSSHYTIYKTYLQRNIKSSRKQLAPLVLSILNSTLKVNSTSRI